MMPANSLSFSIKTSVFEGPLELLLDLVEKRKLLINDISLAQVTDEYLKEVSLMQELSLPNTAHFITLASTLLLVKSKSLLPVLDLTDEEEASIEDLEDRLRRYQVYRDASLSLAENFGKQRMYGPQFAVPAVKVFVIDKYCELAALSEALKGVIEALPKKTEQSKASVKVVISLEEMMERLETRIRHNLKTKFSELNFGEQEKKVIIVSFLAVLELFRQGNLVVVQNNRFDDIEIELQAQDTPRYY